MKISKKDQKLLLCAGGLLLALLAYLLVYRGFSEKNNQLETENRSLSGQIQQLEVLNANKEQYLTDTENLKTEVQNIIDQYPVEVREEDAVMYVYTMENETDIHVNSMTIAPANLLYTMGWQQTQQADPAGTAETENDETTNGVTAETSDTQETGYRLSAVTLNLTYTVSYGGFKDIIDFICSDKNKRNVESISLSYDSETGNLLGTMVVNLFELQGIDKVYEAPYIPSVPRGNTNPFGTSEVIQNNQKETVQDEEENED